MIRFSLIALVVLATALPASAQSDTDVSAAPGVRFVLGGAIQSRVSYGLSQRPGNDVDRFGVGLRRVRFRAAAYLADRASMFFQADGSGGGLAVLDFYAGYKLSPRLDLRMGRLVGAQPRGLILTGLNYIDIMDRANIAERWGQATIGGDGRDFGIDARYSMDHSRIMVFLHNGDGNWSRARGNFKPSISGGSATGAEVGTGMAATAAFSTSPPALEGLEIGGFAGVNSRENPNTVRGGVGRSYTTYGAHAYLGARPGSQPVRVKVDVLGISYEDLPGPGDAQQAFGASVFGAIRALPSSELFVRVESFNPDTSADLDADDYFTAGASYSLSGRRGDAYHKERVTLAWSRFKPGDGRGTEDMVALQIQFVF